MYLVAVWALGGRECADVAFRFAHFNGLMC